MYQQPYIRMTQKRSYSASTPTLMRSGGGMAHSRTAASVVMCAGLATTYLFLPDGGPVAIYRTAAIGAALAIGLGIFLEAQGLRSLIRTDLLMLVALFGLTLVEFFFPQQDLDQEIMARSATHGVEALFIGFCGLIIGRNFGSSSRPAVASAVSVQWRPATLFRIYVVLLFFGYLDMFWAVSFNPVELVHQMLRPRFSQPWSRTTSGGLGDLFGTVSGLLLYLVPAIAGSILANSSRFTFSQKAIIVVGLGFTLFCGFSGGTRNVFCTYLIILFASYILLKRDITWKRVIVLAGVAVVLLYSAAYYMLQFRQEGLENYVESVGSVEGEGAVEGKGWKRATLFIDNNLPTISALTDVFPNRFDYLGSELVFFAILRPLPRALWPAKPDKLSVAAEDALGLTGLTLSSTFVGESYMMGGYPAILMVGLFLGWLAGWWTRFGLDLRSNVGMVLYASGFFAAAASMRSIVFTTTAMLPTVAIWLYAKWKRPRMQTLRAQPVDRRPRI
jgi:hypothetical protein